MDAHDRRLPKWFEHIQSRQITLPRFQRFEAWGPKEISELLTTVLCGRPSGVALILEVGDEEKFESRPMVDAPTQGEKVIEHLLDGQQRLTALWRSMHDKYPDRTYLVGYEEDPYNSGVKIPKVEGQARRTRGGKRYPLWVDDPKDCWRRKLIPISLLRPGDISADIEDWVEKAIPDGVDDRHEVYKVIKRKIDNLRTEVREFNLPYLALPAQTPKEVALDVFIKMNTSSIRLSGYDYVVALVEGETDKSLHDHVAQLKEKVPRASMYAELPDLVLDVVSLRQDRVPSLAGYRGLRFKEMIKEWDTIVDGIKNMVDFLEEETIFDAQRLPSYTAIPVIAALWEYVPKHPDKRGNARRLLRKFLWRAFLTPRYEQSSATNALQDFRKLKEILTGTSTEQTVPILDTESYPLPDPDALLQTRWPKRRTILGRGLLALQIKCGSVDLADGEPATMKSITSQDDPREYHHLFPESTFDGTDVTDEQVNQALNCALVKWRTNRNISNKDPIVYLKERLKKSDISEAELRDRLKTHLIPYEQLAVGYEGLDEIARRDRVKDDYDAFLNARSRILSEAAKRACEGEILNPLQLLQDD